MIRFLRHPIYEFRLWWKYGFDPCRYYYGKKFGDRTIVPYKPEDR